MKRILSMLLAVLFVAGALMLAACSGSGEQGKTTNTAPADKTTDPAGKTSAPADSTTAPADSTTAPVDTTTAPVTTETPTEDTTVTINDDFFTTLLRNKNDNKHKTADSIPANYSLAGSETLPSVYQRGEDIVNPAADAVTYMQYTNAVAQFVRNKDKTSTWTPRDDFFSCFSVKYAGQFGASIMDDYHTLQDNGALTFADDDFARAGNGSIILKQGGKYNTQTTGWVVDQGTGDKSLAYRLLNFAEVNTADDKKVITVSLEDGGGYYSTERHGIEITGSENGKQLLEKIKDAIVTGNVVVAQGKYYSWQYEALEAASGTGAAGDTVITFAIKLSSADEQDAVRKIDYPLCIVGYDDNLEFTTHEQTLKGALLVCNPGDKSWGKDGYAWVMYDALNTNFNCMTEDEGKKAFVLENEEDVRTPALTRFEFVYWDVDITDEKPALYAEIELLASNRNSFCFRMSKTDNKGKNYLYYAWQSYMTYAKLCDKYGQEDTEWFNPKGELNGKATVGYYTVNFARVFDPAMMPEGTTFEDFVLGLRIINNDEKNPITVRSITFKNSKGEVIKEITMPKNTTVTKNTLNIKIDFGKEIAPDLINGSLYAFQNVKTGQTLLKTADKPTPSLGEFTDKKACWVNIEYKSSNNTYKISWRKSATANWNPLDISGNKIEDNAQIFFNPANASSRDTQWWKISYNTDGTYSIYTVDENGDCYALVPNDKGTLVTIKKVTELTDDAKWTITTKYEGDTLNPFSGTVTRDGEKLTVTAADVFTKAQQTLFDTSKVKVSVYSLKGKELTSGEFELNKNQLNAELTVSGLTDEYFLVISCTGKVQEDGEEFTMYPVNPYLSIRL